MIKYFWTTFPSVLICLNLGLIPVDFIRSYSLAQHPPISPKNLALTSEGDRLFIQGMELLQQQTAESRKQAVTVFQDAVKAYQSEKNPKRQAQSLQQIGLVYFGFGQYEKTLDYYQQALSQLQPLNEPSSLAYLLLMIGMVQSKLSQNQLAITTLNQAVELFKTLKDIESESLALNTLSEAYFNLGETQTAIDLLNQSLQRVNTLQAPTHKIDILQKLAMIYLQLGEVQKGKAVFDELKALQPDQEDNIGISLLLDRAVQSQNKLSEGLLSLEEAQQFLDYQESQGNQQAIGSIYQMIALIYSNQGNYQKSLESYQQSLDIFRQLKLPDQEASALIGISSIYQIWGQYQKSLELYDQALKIQQKISDRLGQASTLQNMGYIYRTLGDYTRSLDTYLQALEIAKFCKDYYKIGQTLDDIATVYRLQKDYPQAVDFAQKALQVWQTQDITNGESSTLSTLSRIYESMENYPKALETAQQLQELGKQVQDEFIEASGWIFISRIYLAQNEPQQALNPAIEALSLFQKINNKPAIAPVINQMGKIYTALNQSSEALNSFNQAIAVWKILGDPIGEADSLYYLAKFQQNQGNLEEAKTTIEAALTLVENLRNQVKSQTLRQSYFATVQDYYEFYIDLLMQLHKQQPKKGFDALAFHAAERARARSLLELLTEARADIRQGVDPKLLEQEKQLQAQINTLEQQRIQLLSQNATEERLNTLTQKQKQVNQNYQILLDKIRVQSPEYAALTQPQPLTASEIQQQILDPDTILLEYALGQERSYLWVVSQNQIQSYELAGKATLEASVREFRSALGTKIRIGKINTAAKAMSDLILAPIASGLGQKRLIIVADGALQYIPFAALPEPSTQQPLIINHEIINLPSASTLAVIRQENQNRPKPNKTIAILADPVFNSQDERVNQPTHLASVPPLPVENQVLSRSAKDVGIEWNRLPGTRQEAEIIQSLVPETERLTSLDFKADRNWVMNSNLSQYKIIHFATHGFVNTQEPELSGIVLSLVDEQGKPENGFLRLRDIYNLNLPVELVVLSACQTGLGKGIRGEGLIGLTRGFMYAGSRRVMTSLWSVDDEGTAKLMSIFYEKMFKENLSTAAALRAAQIMLLQDENFSSPYYWAAFSLQGEWKED